jgi:hypothetical protein
MKIIDDFGKEQVITLENDFIINSSDKSLIGLFLNRLSPTVAELIYIDHQEFMPIKISIKH